MRINYKTQIRAEIRKAGQMNAAEGKMAGKAERMAETSHEGNTREHVTKCTYEYGDKARWVLLGSSKWISEAKSYVLPQKY